MVSGMNILFLTARYPYPLIGGDRLKPYNLLSYLSRKNKVTLLSFYQGKALPAEYKKHIEDMNIQVECLSLNPVTAGLKSIPKTLFKGQPLEIAYYNAKEYSEKLHELLAKNKYDLCFSFFMRTGEHTKNINMKKVLIAEDCRTLYQLRSYKESNNLKQKIVRFWDYSKLKKYEIELQNRFDAVTMVSPNDIEYMKDKNPAPDYFLLKNGVDIDLYVPPAENNRKNILFAGKLDVWSNELTAIRIVEHIFPAIRQAHPEVQLIIAGANPSKHLMSYRAENIEVHANVPSMIPFLQQAALFLHPHSGGSGIQNKLLEALSCGCPVVTTPTGIQGICAKDGYDVLIGTTNEELSNKINIILDEPQKAKEISLNSRKLIENYYSWEIVFNDLEKVIEFVMEKN